MTSKWSKSEETSTEAPKSDYLINYDGKVFTIKASEKEVKAALKILKNIRAWRCEEIEQEEQSPPSQGCQNLQQNG